MEMFEVYIKGAAMLMSIIGSIFLLLANPERERGISCLFIGLPMVGSAMTLIVIWILIT
jgi:hypothetical protein